MTLRHDASTTASIDRLRTELGAPTPQTLRYLRATLGLGPAEACVARPSRPQAIKQPLTKSAGIGRPPVRPGPKHRDTQRSKFHIHESIDNEAPKLSDEDCYKVATQAFNFGLKRLAEAIKSHKDSPETRTVNRTPLGPHQQERYIDRDVSKGADNPKNRDLTTQDPDMGLVVQCSRCALQFLRNHRTGDGQSGSGEDISLMKGALILLDRSISLNLAKQAVLQLNEIHDWYWSGHQTEGSGGPWSIARGLLGRPDAADDGAVFAFTTNMQEQALRLLLLIGSDGMSQELCRSLHLDTVGSPAWITLDGLRKGHLKPGKAGSRLQTIALATSKLYKSAVKSSPQKISPRDLLELSGLSLPIKLKSWPLLGHTPEPLTELWRPFHYTLKHLALSTTDLNATSDLILQSVNTLRGLLNNAKYPPEIPAEVAETLLDVLQDPEHLARFAMLVEEGLIGSPRSDLVLQCQLTIALLKNPWIVCSKTLGSVRSMERTLTLDRPISDAELIRFLPHLAKLRKAIAAIIQTEQADFTKRKDQIRSLQSSLVHLLYASFAFLRRNMTTISTPTSTYPIAQTEHPFPMTLIRSIDLLLSTRCHSVTKSMVSEQKSWDVLKDCSATVHELQTKYSSSPDHSSVSAQCSELRMRISSAFWSHYLTVAKTGKTFEEQADILELSLKGMLDLPVSSQRDALVAVKFERLSSCYLELQNIEMATSSLQQAIAASIRQGDLGNVVESLLSGPFNHAWADHNSNGKVFGRLLARYGKVRVGHAPQESLETCLYDDASLPPIHRAALRERQMLSMLELSLSSRQIDEYPSMVDKLLQMLTDPKYYAYKLRLLTRLFHLTLKKRLLPSTFAATSTVVQQLLGQTMEFNGTVYLRKFELEFRSLLFLQHGLFTGNLDCRELKRAVGRLAESLLPCDSLLKAEQCCEDLVSWITPLLLAVEFAGITEEYRVALTVLDILEDLANLGLISPSLCRKRILIRKSDVNLLLRNIDCAQKSLMAAAKCCQDGTPDPLLDIELALTYSDYYLQVQGFEQCSHWLQQARGIWESLGNSAEPSPKKSVLREQSLLCKAGYLSSRLAFQQNRLAEAVALASLSTKIAASMWCSIRKAYSQMQSSQHADPVDAELHCLSTEISKLNLSRPPPSARQTVAAMNFAPYSLLCCTALLHHAFLLSHCGIYSDAAAYYGQALQIAKETCQSGSASIASSELGVLHARAGQREKAMDQLQVLSLDIIHGDTGWLQVLVAANQGEAHLVLGDLAAAQQCLDDAKKYQLANAIQHSELSIKTGANDAKKTTCRVKASVTKRTATRRTDRGRHCVAVAPVLPSARSLELRNVGSKISALEARLRWMEDHELGNIMSTDVLTHIEEGDGRKSISVALSLLQSAIQLFSDDAAHSALAETAVALPVRYRSARQSERVSFVQAIASRTTLSSKSGSTKHRSDDGTHADGSTLLQEAYDLLHRLHDSQPDRFPSDVLHASHKIMTQINLLSTALKQPLSLSSSEIVRKITYPSDLAQLRQKYINLGAVTAARRIDTQEWPSADQLHQRSLPASHLKLGYEMELLPPEWTVVCLELNEDKTELIVARLSHSKSPFVVRIPLTRPDPSESSTHGFDLESAKEEMARIKSGANATAQDARGSSADKSIREIWFAERRALDKQLSELLDEIENVWLGGFRGLLCCSRADESRLWNFGQCLSLTLNRHLPSRQKTTKSDAAAIWLHDHVLELFVGLGHPQEGDLEDAVVDLLYFVVDILQFNGERNAYDEIDFDAMLVEVLEAMHAYHDAERGSQRQNGHMILVVDKELQGFPWESLRCLRGRAVSRMPSLSSIWDRLKTRHEQPKDKQDYLIRRTNGAYILNPASDLKSTQDTFGQLFADQLPEYKAIVNRPPDSMEFETALENHDLLLYFGHGNGGQYIRPRTISKMHQCAVALLMGCSSAELKEYGAYEPQGMAFSYLGGGSPAVVGNLWDVTDRDIDRFALELMEAWGLVDATGSASAQSARKSHKSQGRRARELDRRAPKGERPGPVSLDQAVASARDACWLKYLNGAAPVMYGVPIMLS